MLRMKTLFLLVITALTLPMAHADGPRQRSPHSPNEWVVKTRKGATSLKRSFPGLHQKRAFQIGDHEFQVVSPKPGIDVQSFERMLAANPDIVEYGRNTEVSVRKVSQRLKARSQRKTTSSKSLPWRPATNDSLGDQLAHFSKDSSTYEYATRAETAWSAGLTGSPEIIVAVLDSGIDLLHPDLAQNAYVSPGEIAGDGTDNDNNGYTDDVNGDNGQGDRFGDFWGHGTHVAGIIGAVGNNGVGVAGINWRVKLLPIKVLDDNGTGDADEVPRAIQYAVRQGAKVINISAVGDRVPGMREAIQEAQDHGVIVVAAAGNATANLDYGSFIPQAPNVIHVASVNPDGALSWFSSFGAKSVDLAAPGYNILSTFPGGTYRTMSGTSQATPMVAGAAALLMSIFPDENFEQIVRRIVTCVRPLPSPDDRAKLTSGGALDIHAAIAGCAPDMRSGFERARPSDPGNVSLSRMANGDVKVSWSATIEGRYLISANEGLALPEDYCKGGQVIENATSTVLAELHPNIPLSVRVCAVGKGNEVSVGATATESMAPFEARVEPALESATAYIQYSRPEVASYSLDLCLQPLDAPGGCTRKVVETKANDSKTLSIPFSPVVPGSKYVLRITPKGAGIRSDFDYREIAFQIPVPPGRLEDSVSDLVYHPRAMAPFPNYSESVEGSISFKNATQENPMLTRILLIQPAKFDLESCENNPGIYPSGIWKPGMAPLILTLSRDESRWSIFFSPLENKIVLPPLPGGEEYRAMLRLVHRDGRISHGVKLRFDVPKPNRDDRKCPDRYAQLEF